MKKHIKTAVLISLLAFFIMPQPADAQIFETIFGITNCALAADKCRTDFNSCKERITRAATACGERKDKKLQSCKKILQRADSKLVSCQKKQESCVATAQKTKANCENFKDNQSRYQSCIKSAESRLQKCSSSKARCDSTAQKNKGRALARNKSCVDKAKSDFAECQSATVSKEARAVASCTKKFQSCISRLQKRCPGI